jgi:DnaJ-class molecular chaperone
MGSGFSERPEAKKGPCPVAKDLYKTLGVAKTATEAELRKAYRALAKKHHPDLNVGNKEAAERFKEIASAYDILGDADKRKRYDAGEIDESGQERPERQFYRQYAEGPAGGKYRQGPGGGFRSGGPASDDAADIFGGDIFSELFGRGGGSPFERAQARGGDVSYTLKISFLDAARGGPKRITLPDGSTLDVTIPAGINDGQTLRLKGKGQAGRSGTGDAYVKIEVEPHADFERKGNDIHSSVPVALDEAVLGGKIEAETVSGPIQVTVPAGSNTGGVLRLKGKGIAPAQGAPGDHYVHLEIVLPKAPDPELRAFLEEWRKSHRYDPRKR